MCDACGGVWLDGPDVKKAYAAFDGLVDRLGDVPLPDAGRGAPIVMCPRCKGLVRPFAFFDLVLDVCLDCQGLWVDAHELEDLARSADRSEGLPAPAPRYGYRDNAAAAVRSGVVSCKTCQRHVALDAAHVTSIGPMCAACAEAHRSKRLDAMLKGYEPPTEPIVDLSFVGDFFQALPFALGAALSVGTRCSHCGCRQSSHCSC